ncbi:MAG: response regulator transcription factor [Anaerolineae bacterium]|nr:response regulator transcription factor [Anaerolineae bacterium]
MGIRTFLVDDHGIIRDGLRLLLETHKDITVVGNAVNGRQAVLEIEKSKPDVVVMDIAMPDLNGIEATRQICNLYPDIKVIILSMYFSYEHINRAIQAGASGYLLKESVGQEVIEAVLAVSQGRRYFSKVISDTIITKYIDQLRSMPISNPLESLSAREREVLQLIVEGKSNAVIAESLSLSVKSIETYKSRIMTKLDIHNIPDLVKLAIQHGLITLDDHNPPF